MVRAVVFSDEITLWWERKFDFLKNGAFLMTLNGKTHGKTKKNAL